MILLRRGTEPDALRQVRARELPLLRERVRRGDLGVIEGYRCVADDLWRAQHHKCCYCEHLVQRSFHDVEHYRPKAAADRSPGCVHRHGYWWLAFHWENLLFACPGCNRSGKNDRFPLELGSVTLAAGRRPPGQEMPLLLDPATDNGIEHIEFVPQRLGPSGQPEQWRPVPRGGSRRGLFTIEVLGLDRQELIELYTNHVGREVQPVAQRLCAALRGHDPQRAEECRQRALELLLPSRPYVGLSYDALRRIADDASLRRRGLSPWPAPAELAAPRPGRRRR